ncbi:phosphate ABC transporter substrate-binding protein, partial [Clostridioides difficile]
PIVIVSREEGSGTRDGFQEIVGFDSEELTKDAQISDGSGNINGLDIGYLLAITFASVASTSFIFKLFTFSSTYPNDIYPIA